MNVRRYFSSTLIVFALVTVGVSTSRVCADVPSEEQILSDLKSKTPIEKVVYLHFLERGTDRDVFILFQTGNAYYAASGMDSAIANYIRVVERDPQHFKAYVNMGIAYDESRQARAGQASYKKALEIRPDDVLAHCHLGYNLVHQGHVDEGIDHYLRALEIEPDSPQAHYNLGLAFADMKVFNEAIREWLKVVEVEPDSDLGKTAAENVELIKTYLAIDP